MLNHSATENDFEAWRIHCRKWLVAEPPPFWLVGLLGNPGTHARGYAAVHQAAAACSSRCVLYIGSVGCSAACLPIIAEYQQAVGVGQRTLSVAADLDRSHRVAGRVLDLHRRRLQPLPPLLTAPSTHASAARRIYGTNSGVNASSRLRGRALWADCPPAPILRNFSGCTISKVHVWCNALTLSKVSTS